MEVVGVINTGEWKLIFSYEINNFSSLTYSSRFKSLTTRTNSICIKIMWYEFEQADTYMILNIIIGYK